MEIIGSGTYGCVYYPGFQCNGNKQNKNSKLVTKITNDEIGYFLESEIGFIIKKNIPNYKSFFIIVEKDCSIQKKNVNNYVKKSCSIIEARDKHKQYYLMYSRFVDGYDLKDYFLMDLTKPNNVMNYYNNFFIYTQNLIEALNELQQINIVHFDISFKNIRIETKTNNALIFDFGMSIIMDKLIEEYDYSGNINKVNKELLYTFFSINPIESPKYCFEIQIICYIILNKKLDDYFTENDLMELIKDYYKKNNIFSLFTNDFKQQYIKSLIDLYSNYVNQQNIYVIMNCLNSWRTWDSFNLNFHFLTLLYNLEYFHKLTLDMIQMFMLQIHPNYKKRKLPYEQLQLFYSIINQQKSIESILNYKLSLQKIDVKSLSKSFQKSLKLVSHDVK